MTRWRRDPQVLWRRSGGRRILLCPGSDEPIVLDGVAATSWDLLVEPAEHRELVGILSEHFSVDAEVVGEDLQTYLGDLADHGAVRSD